MYHSISVPRVFPRKCLKKHLVLIFALHLFCFVSTLHQNKVGGTGKFFRNVLHFDPEHRTFSISSIICIVLNFLLFVWFAAAIVSKDGKQRFKAFLKPIYPVVSCSKSFL